MSELFSKIIERFKGFIIYGIVFIVLFYFVGVATPNSSSDFNPQTGTEGQRITELLLELQSTDINSERVQNLSETTSVLADYSIGIADADVGKTNPFLR